MIYADILGSEHESQMKKWVRMIVNGKTFAHVRLLTP